MPAPEPRNFEPKDPANLAKPKDDPISVEYLAKCDGTSSDYPTYVAIKGTVFDVTGNKSYTTGVFAGKDASRALAKSSVKAEDAKPEWSDLPDKEKGVLNDWYTFFSKRYNIVGKVTGA